VRYDASGELKKLALFVRTSCWRYNTDLHEQKGIMPPQAGMPHALNPRYPDLSELNIEIPAEPKEFKSVDQKPRRILLNNFDAAVRLHHG
jgi:hypothetical protein